VENKITEAGIQRQLSCAKYYLFLFTGKLVRYSSLVDLVVIGENSKYWLEQFSLCQFLH